MSSFAENSRDVLPAPVTGPVAPVVVFGIGLAAMTIAFAVSVAIAGASFGPGWAVLVLGACSILAERHPVRVNSNVEITVSILPVIFAAVVFGPLSAMAVGALGMVITLGQPYIRWLIWTSTRALGAGLAGAVAGSVLIEDPSPGRLLLAVALACFFDAAFDAALGAVLVAVRGSGSARDGLRLLRPILVGTVPLYTPVIVLLIYAYAELSTWSILLFLAPAFAAHRLHGLYREQRETTAQLSVANDRLSRANLSFATALVAALDARDQYTAGHSAAVAVYARDIAKRMGLSEQDQGLVHLCGLVHDIGKVGLPAGLLEKPGALTPEERRRMEEHSVIGERILGKVEGYAEIAHIVRHHHERMDGNGYPDRLSADEIPLLSRIIAVADAYNAMTSGRPYRDAMSSCVARFRLAQAAGTQFDTSVVTAFEAILANAAKTYLDGVRPDFAIEAQRQPVLVARAAVSA